MQNPFPGVAAALPRRVIDRIVAHGQRMYAKSAGAQQRIEAAQAKRDRKNAKRAEIARRNAA